MYVLDGTICTSAETIHNMSCSTGVINVTAAYWSRYRLGPGCGLNVCPCDLSYLDCQNQANVSFTQRIKDRCDGRTQCTGGFVVSNPPRIFPSSLCSGNESPEPHFIRIIYHCLSGKYQITWLMDHEAISHLIIVTFFHFRASTYSGKHFCTVYCHC